MRDEEILARFDGRGGTEFLLGGFEALNSHMITAIASKCGYDLRATELPGKSAMRLIYVRNDAPLARRRAQQTQERLRAGGPLCLCGKPPDRSPGPSGL